MALNQRKYEHKHEAILRDVRPLTTRIADALSTTNWSTLIFIAAGMGIYFNEWLLTFADLIMVFLFLYFLWLISRDRSLAFKLPMGAKFKDKNNGRNGKKGKAEGILYLGNVEKTNEEVWFTNSDARTHVLYLGTTGAGKTEGLKSMVTNAMAWGSGFVYVDGKADTDLWSSLSSLVRRFGRDDDLLVLNYMTGNADVKAPSNTMNPFSSGSASYLVNMLVSLMPESEGDNAMWKERAVSLVGSIMPILTWKRDNQDIPMSVRTIRDYLSLNNVIKLARDDTVPKHIRDGLSGYLATLPGFIGDAYDDNGNVKPPGPDTPQYNTETASQQHGYLAMQFTRSLQSLGDDYGYIFDTQAADVDMVDVVLNRRILVVLIPALEKSGDEVANLGKIVAATMKGMMGSTLGSTVEGSSETVIENKPTHSATPFMTVFDEVGYYTAQGMAVMAAQARSLGFCLVFSGQDLPAMKKRVREEANSITANCNIKIFGKLEDPTETKEFFEKTVGSAMVTEVSGFQMAGGSELGSYHDSKQAGVQLRPRASYDGLRGFKEGQAVITFGETVVDCGIFYSNPGHAKAMRVTRFMTLSPPDENIIKHAGSITKLRDLMVNKSWTAMRADVAVETSEELAALNEGFTKNNRPNVNPIDAGICALVGLYGLKNDIPDAPPGSDGGSGGSSGGPATPPPQTPPPLAPLAPVQPPAPVAAAPIAPLVAQKPADIASSGEKSGAGPMGFFSKAPETPKETPEVKPAAPVTPPVTPAPEQQDQPQQAKPSIFGTTPSKTEAPAPIEPPAQIPTVPAAEKPSIFGAPQKKEEAPVTDTAPIAPPPLVKTETPDAKPSIFGSTPAQKPDMPAPIETPKVEAPKTETPATPEAPAKPTIFGAAPQKAENAAPVEPPPQTPAAPTQPSAPETPAKPSIFGAPQKAEPPAPPAQPFAQEAPAKPAIFGTAPKSEEPPVPQTTQNAPIAPPPLVKTETAETKPAIFGAKPAAPAETPTETPVSPVAPEAPAKPSIFGAAPKPAEQLMPQTTQSAPAAEAPTAAEAPAKPAIFGAAPQKPEAPTPIETPEIEKPKTEIQTAPEASAKPAIFGAAPQKTESPAPLEPAQPPAAPIQTSAPETPAKPAIFGAQPTTPPQEPATEPEKSQPQKPAIFGAPTKKEETTSDDDQ